MPIVSNDDYRGLDGYVIHFERELNEVEAGADVSRGERRLFGRARAQAAIDTSPARKRGRVTEEFGPGTWRRVEGDEPRPSAES